MTKPELVQKVAEALTECYPDVACALKYEKPYQLLMAVRLSAQCTDARVNLITPILFERYPTLEAFAEADIEELESIVKPCGFYHMKAKSIKEMAIQLLTKYNGIVPDNMKDLLSLSGVGRKTANLILGDIYGLSLIHI